MAKKQKKDAGAPSSAREHIERLVKWMSQGVYEKEQIIAMSLLCAVAGENMFLLGPPGTAKSMVASRLKKVFRDGKSFDYLMSRFSTPDEIFGPVSIARLKNDDRYERLTSGYLPEADVVFLDEIWKAGPSIQNTLLTVINEHLFHNGGVAIRTPMKVLIAASNELPAKDEGLEALWDRFLVRMVSNCIESDSAFFKMIRNASDELTPLEDCLFITDELYSRWQEESKLLDMDASVMNAIRELRRILASREKNDGNQLRFYVSDRRWRKAFRLMQTSAFLNGRSEINLTDYLLLIHCFWNDVETIPAMLESFMASIADSTLKRLNKIDRQIRQLMTPQSSPQQQSRQMQSAINDSDIFAEFDYFYYLVENFPDGDTYFSKWDYKTLTSAVREGVRYYDEKRKKFIIHTLVPGTPFDAKAQNASRLTKVRLQRCQNGALIDGVPYAFRRKAAGSESGSSQSVYQQFMSVRLQFSECVSEWEDAVARNWANCDNLFLSSADLTLINKAVKEVSEQIKAIEVKINNVAMLIH